MTLVAPTGKAAARLVESIKKSKAGLDCAEDVRGAIVESASTIHRCLGSLGRASIGFRHHAGNRLVTDVVLVDEASMVNLGLMRRLVSAMPDHARLILLGDMDQLASVEAGAVLGEICNSGQKRMYSPALQREVKALGGGNLPEDQTQDSLPAISDCVAKLQKSYRFQGETGIAALARAINSGDSQAATEVLDRYDDVLLVPPSTSGNLGGVLRDAALAGYRPYLQPGEAKERLARFDQFRILCARRTGPFGVEALNEQVTGALRRAGLIASKAENYDGKPIMITANTYELQIYNGDIGLVLPDPQSGQLRACFAGGGGELRMFAPSRLPHQESALAMSVHKSQGSEFDEVAIVLPEEPAPLLTRELIYTAVTRAKKRVVIHSHPAVLRYAIEHPTERSSGLGPKLWGSQGL
jgi:exodeoxyribonuclease V alpha subunit